MKQTGLVIGVLAQLVLLTGCGDSEKSVPTKGLNIIDEKTSEVLKAKELEVGDSASGKLSDEYYETYYFSASADQTYYINLKNTGGDADLYLGSSEVVDVGDHSEGENLIASSRLHGDTAESILFTAASTQDYFIVVRGYGVDVIHYDLSVTHVVSAIKLDPNGNETLGEITFDEASSFFTDRDDVKIYEPRIHLATDLYVFDADPQLSYRIRLISLDESDPDNLHVTDTYFGPVALYVYQGPALAQQTVEVGVSQLKVSNDEVIVYGRGHSQCPSYEEIFYCNDDTTTFYIDVRGFDEAGYGVIVEELKDKQTLE